MTVNSSSFSSLTVLAQPEAGVAAAAAAAVVTTNFHLLRPTAEGSAAAIRITTECLTAYRWLPAIIE